MNRLFCLALLATTFSFFQFNLRAEDTPSPFTLPSGDPLVTLAFPQGSVREKVSIAVSKALVEEQWENLNWEGNVTIATATQSRVNIKVFAVATATEVKLYASYSSDKNANEEKCRKIALRQLRYLEKTIVAKLNLVFHQAKGDDTIDTATAK